MEVGGAELTYGTMAIFAVGLFLLAGVYSLLKQGLKLGALFVLALAALAFTGGVMWL